MDVLLFLKLISLVSIAFYNNFIDFIILLYTSLVIHFARYKEYIFCLISDKVFRCIACIYLWKYYWQSFKHLFRSLYFESFSKNWSIVSLRIIIKEFDNFFSWFVKCFSLFYRTCFALSIYTSLLIFHLYLIHFFVFLVPFLVLHKHSLYFYKKLVDF